MKCVSVSKKCANFMIVHTITLVEGLLYRKLAKITSVKNTIKISFRYKSVGK